MDSAKKPRTTCESGSLLNGGQQRRSVQEEELRRLEDEIKKAYVLKALHAQLAEQEANRLAADIQARIADEVTRCRADAADQERDRIQRIERELRTDELRAALERQLDDKRNERAILEEEERDERRLLVELDKLREEREQYEKIRKKEELAEHLLLQNFVHQEIREIDSQKLLELEAELTTKNQLYLRELEERAEHLNKLRLDARKKREEAISAVAEMLLQLERERSERQRLLTDLMVEEVKLDAEVEAKETELRRRQKMREFAEGLEEQIRFEEECRRLFLKRERQLAEAIMIKVMESEKMERLTAELRRRRRLEYREDLERVMRERERTREQELARLRLALEEERRKEDEEMQAVRRARLLLLERHVDHVADFMSKKSLYDDERGVLDQAEQKKKDAD